jgi:nucleoside-diphosphate kinase
MSLTFLLIKPDAVNNGFVDDIVKFVENAGFEVLARKQKVLSRTDEIFLCPMHIGKDFFNDLIAFMTSSSSELFILRGENATMKLDGLVGITDPEKNSTDTLRGKFGTSIRCNAVHSPNSEENAVRELLYFFPEWEWNNTRAI